VNQKEEKSLQKKDIPLLILSRRIIMETWKIKTEIIRSTSVN